MLDDSYITREKFINLLVSFSGIPREELLFKGVLETKDLSDPGEPIERRSVAEILHNYIRIVLDIKDEEDIKEAYILKDLFDCRVCANHIAQVYLKGIMDAVNVDGLHIFNVFGKVSEEEAEKYLQNTQKKR